MESGSLSVRVPAGQVAHSNGVIGGEFNKRIIFKGMARYGETTRENAERQGLMEALVTEGALTSTGLKRGRRATGAWRESPVQGAA